MINLATEKPVSIKQVMELFSVHRRTVEAWFDKGLERVKVGGRVYTTMEAVGRFAEFDAGQAPGRARSVEESQSLKRSKKALEELKKTLSI